MKTIKGNLLDLFDAGEFDIIIHGCNLQQDMSGGIAYQIAQRYPQAAENDRLYGTAAVLGGFTMALVGEDQLIFNLYTQVYPGRDARLFAVMKGFRWAKKFIEGKRVGIPMIGAGIGGLEWSDVELVLDRMGLDNVTVVEFG